MSNGSSTIKLRGIRPTSVNPRRRNRTNLSFSGLRVRPRNFAPRRQNVVGVAQRIAVQRPQFGVLAARRRPNGSRRGRNGMGRGGLFTGSRTNQRTKRTITVNQDEYIAEINGSTGFVNTQYPINPGQAVTFPWLSRQALQWEKYSFEMLEFYYKPEVSGFATNGQAGKVILGADYDASDAPPINKQAIEDTDPRVDCMPYQSVALKLSPVEMHNSFGKKFVRPGAIAANQDIKTYDAGNLNVATYGNTNTSLLGELRVRYRVRLEVPVLEPVQNLSQAFHSTNPTTANTFGANAIQDAGSSPIVTLAGNVMTFLVAGNFMVNLLVQGTTATETANPAISAGGTINYNGGGGSGTATLSIVVLASVIPGTTLTFNNTIVAGTGAQTYITSANTAQA